ncbi:head GIN domain-containing protein [Zunongwangia sp.]|uniref:head GIN domain-containing protein n=1 Tax=Zunongwangia sp. TaxID=1965325 RepID=UPI003AA884E7
MKKFVCIVMMSIGLLTNAQESKHDLDNFDKIFAYDNLPVTLIHGDDNKAVVTGKSRSEVEFDIDGTTLRIKLGIDNLWSDDDDTKVVVYYKDLNEVRAKRNASIVIEDKIKTNLFTLEAQEGGDVTGDFEVNHLTAFVRSGGEITPSGTSKNQEVSINTGGKYYAKNLESDYLNIKIKAGGVADVTVTGKVTAKVRAGGTVNVYGNPEEIDKSTLFGGDVVRKN